MDRVIKGITPFVTAANIWAQDAIAHEAVLNNVLSLLDDPDFLVYHASKVWQSRIQANGQAAIEWISDEYLALLDAYEAKYAAANNGNASPIKTRMQGGNAGVAGVYSGFPAAQEYQSYQPQQQYQQPQFQQPQFQQQQIPMPPVPGNPNNYGGGPVEVLKQRIEMLKTGNPTLGQSLQRMHHQQRQQMGVDIYV